MNSSAYAALLAAGLLPLLCAGLAKFGRKDYDNRDPRAWAAQLSGYRARAQSAQANGHESFPFFAAALLAALQAGVPAETVSWLGWVYVAVRLAYIWAYVRDRSTLRSWVWLVGHGLVVALLVLAIRA